MRSRLIKTEVVLKFIRFNGKHSTIFRLIKTEVVLKFNFQHPFSRAYFSLIKTEVVLKYVALTTLLLPIRFNKNRSCIEISIFLLSFYIFCLFNKNRSCIEIICIEAQVACAFPV